MKSLTIPRAWGVFGALLPRSIREGVFEPTYLDLWRGFVLSGPNTTRRKLLVWTCLTSCFLAAFCYGLPRYFRDRGRTTRAGWVVGIGLATTGFVAFALLAPWLSFLLRNS